MNKLNALFAAIALSILGTLIGGLYWWSVNAKPVTDVEQYQGFVVPRGRSASEVAVMLHSDGLIRSPLAFKIYVQLFDKSKKINAGEFQLSSHMSLSEIVESLGRGPIELWVTIPEGLRKEEMVNRFVMALEMNEVDAKTFETEFLTLSAELEGYLFPDTYLFPRDVAASAVISMMTSIFERRLDTRTKDAIENSRYDLNDYVVMASIIEREAKTDLERPIIAGVLWKRLESDGWLMQVDASVQYAVANRNCGTLSAYCENWWPILTKDDMEIDSPYNSYKYKSLPPTPISNPGAASIRAAVFAQESPYWFYIHDREGNIHYAESLDQHNANIARYLVR